MRTFVSAFVVALLTASSCGGGAIAQPPARPPTPGFILVWSDEFSSANGSAPDSTRWTYDLGGGGWGNQELQSYTSRPQNVQIQKGNLVITALQENYTGTDGIARNYTSARLKSQNLFAQAYGRFEARIKIARGQGIWPAFWMLGNDITQNGWPKCGEIDLMENIGREPGIIHGSLHGPSSVAPTSDRTSTIFLPAGQNYADDFHVYAIEWEPGAVRFYLDSNNYATFTEDQWPSGGQWVFDHPFFIILNLAVGGVWPGNPGSTTQFPQQMLVDYVRVYFKN